MKLWFKLIPIFVMSLLLVACAYHLPTSELARLEYGKRLFLTGYYKPALKELLPLACQGCPAAEYAVGYLYYYGFGVAQDAEVGCFWITRAANHGFKPAMAAHKLITDPIRNPIYGNKPYYEAVGKSPRQYRNM